MAVRMAHIQLPEDLGIEDAILPGDPARVDWWRRCWSSPRN